MPNNEYANEPNQSRSEDIIQSILDGTEYDEAARSRIEYLLIELKNAIEGGGGGGGVTSYSPLTEKPKIDNHTLQSGNNTSSDLGLQTKIDADHKLSADVIDDTNSTNKFNVKSDWNAASGAAGEILNKPTLGTASAKNVPVSGDAATGEVVLGSDTRLTDARNAKDVYNWAKQENKPSYGYSEIQNTPTIPDKLSDLTDDSTHRTVTDAEKNTWNGKQNALTFDNAPTSNSDNPVKSGGVYTALSGKQNNLSEAQMAAANSGIDSTKVAQIETNKNNILSSWTLGKGESIPNYSDLNNYTSIGNYYHSGNPVNNGLINLPTQSGVAFRLTVYLSNGNDRPAQIYEESATTKKWKRYNNAQGVWGQWVLIGDNIATMQTNISTNQNNISYISKNNVINVFTRQAGTYSHNGVTFTTNADGSITLANTATGGAAVLTLSSSLDTTDDTYILYGDGFISGVYMDTFETGYANRREFTTYVETTTSTKIWRIVVDENTNVNGVTLRPMMCKKSLFDNNYHQYAMSNVELTNELTNDYTSNLSSTYIDVQNSSFVISKIGKMCIAKFDLTTNYSALTGNDIISSSTKIPSAYLPKSTTYTSAVSRDAGSWASANFNAVALAVATDGTVYLRTGAGASSSKYIVGEIMWFVS